MTVTLKQLIYSKMADLETTQQLLQIADSPTWVEDLIDLIITRNSDALIENEVLKKEIREFKVGGIICPRNIR